MTPLDDLLAACNDLSNDGHYATKTRTLARRIAAWAQTVTAPTPIPTPPATPVPVGALMFSEDFTAPLNPAKWDVKTHDRWLAANVTVHDGMLDIQATRDAAGVWHGGEIQGLAPAYQYVGPRYMEARAVVPKGAGTWAAPLWEWNAPWGGLGIECDVNEQLGKDPGRYYMHLHNGPSESVGISIETGLDLSAAFHRYGCAVYADRADYYFDGAFVGTIGKSQLTAWPFTTTPMVVVIDLDMGGTWAGPVTVSPPVHMLVDYVNVWRLP